MDKILIIDDNQHLRDNFVELLELNNYEVHQAAEGLSGLLIARQELPQIILCDIHMPVMDGFDVLQGIRNQALTSAIPFVFFTAAADSETHCRSLEIGADDFISKTSTEEEFLSAVRCRIDKGKLIAERRAEDKLKYVKELEILLYSISHSVRSPLCSSLGLLNLWEANEQKEIDKKTTDIILNGIKTNTLKLDDYTKALTVQLQELLAKIQQQI
ncbi:hypothetical protein CNR22_18630 [Sphingobacteriaceae bacterium]|nr:hypothetical protein CNR22_18630 [Sphingobacteriaceae bacterium]